MGVSALNWERVLQALCRAGKVCVDEVPTRRAIRPCCTLGEELILDFA